MSKILTVGDSATLHPNVLFKVINCGIYNQDGSWQVCFEIEYEKDKKKDILQADIIEDMMRNGQLYIKGHEEFARRSRRTIIVDSNSIWAWTYYEKVNGESVKSNEENRYLPGGRYYMAEKNGNIITLHGNGILWYVYEENLPWRD